MSIFPLKMFTYIFSSEKYITLTKIILVTCNNPFWFQNKINISLGIMLILILILILISISIVQVNDLFLFSFPFWFQFISTPTHHDSFPFQSKLVIALLKDAQLSLIHMFVWTFKKYTKTFFLARHLKLAFYCTHPLLSKYF